MSLFITSDTHFGHSRIIELSRRSFQSLADMEETIIARWNEWISARDDVWHLGDFTFRTADPRKYFDRLNGRKHLIAGNHDSDETKTLGWVDVQDLRNIRFNHQKFVLCHYPLLEWDGFYRGAIHLHGHQHNKTALRSVRRVDVGVDGNDYRPWAIEELAELVAS